MSEKSGLPYLGDFTDQANEGKVYSLKKTARLLSPDPLGFISYVVRIEDLVIVDLDQVPGSDILGFNEYHLAMADDEDQLVLLAEIAGFDRDGVDVRFLAMLDHDQATVGDVMIDGGLDVYTNRFTWDVRVPYQAIIGTPLNYHCGELAPRIVRVGRPLN